MNALDNGLFSFKGIFTLLIVLALPFATACSDVDYLQGQVVPLEVITGDTDDDPVDPVDPTCSYSEFLQPVAPQYDKIDILFVTDTSGSIGTERAAAVTAGIQTYLNQLATAGVMDFQVSVMLAHAASSHSGVLYSYYNNPKVLTTQSDIANYFSENLKNGPSESATDGGEAGLLSLQKAVTVNKGVNIADGFFRADAVLNVIFIADENDICATFPDGYTRLLDPQGIEIPAFAQYCSGISPASVVTAVKALHNSAPTVFGAIAYTERSDSDNDGEFDTFYRGLNENEYGFGYLDIIDMTNGVAIDMGMNDFVTGLEEAAANAIVNLDLVTSLVLQAAFTIDPQTVAVTVDGSAAGHTYSEELSLVNFLDPGEPGSLVRVDFCSQQLADSEM